jgi:hypothetical protein
MFQEILRLIGELPTWLMTSLYPWPNRFTLRIDAWALTEQPARRVIEAVVRIAAG